MFQILKIKNFLIDNLLANRCKRMRRLGMWWGLCRSGQSGISFSDSIFFVSSGITGNTGVSRGEVPLHRQKGGFVPATFFPEPPDDPLTTLVMGV